MRLMDDLKVWYIQIEILINNYAVNYRRYVR